MKHIVAGQEAASAAEFVELALGTPLELWLGVPGESAEERAARVDAARDIIGDDPGLYDRVTRIAATLIKDRTPHLFDLDAGRRVKGWARGTEAA
ncbi:hypothetical protein [Streptomyces sp. ISL-11]|uniref:hypothetical protein n=1 Tax=Streptomyces sp. ISL-11 TaxID=2819174 RepID=UPI001BEAABEA|nr:hypothetical protein [Streptomyces sp. ISL-11]MBT2382088.1 hypothetical protein [Streptomyces sp. ISL-11]